MKGIIATGTDVATVCFFDPSALPGNFDERSGDDVQEMLTELAAQGRVWTCETGADGAFLFHFYVDEEVPALIRKYSIEPQSTPRFLVPGGTICACGAEFAARDPWNGPSAGPKGGLNKYSHMGGKFELPAGEYEVMAWRTEWPDELLEQTMEKAVGLGRARGHNRLGIATGVLFVACLIGTFITAMKVLQAWSGGRLNSRFAVAAGILMGAWILCTALMRKLSRMEKDPRRVEADLQFPSIVVQMKRLPSQSTA